MLESIGEAVTSGIRLWKATAPTALHSDYAPERPERRSRMWAAGSRGSGSSELVYRQRYPFTRAEYTSRVLPLIHHVPDRIYLGCFPITLRI